MHINAIYKCNLRKVESFTFLELLWKNFDCINRSLVQEETLVYGFNLLDMALKNILVILVSFLLLATLYLLEINYKNTNTL